MGTSVDGDRVRQCLWQDAEREDLDLGTQSREVRDPRARKEFFRKAVEAGVVGVKVDFPPACNREVSNWYYDVAKDAADAHLLVDFHGANKPTGMDRTWPNVLTREGLRGHEYQITRSRRLLHPDHDVILPFTVILRGRAITRPLYLRPRNCKVLGGTSSRRRSSSRRRFCALAGIRKSTWPIPRETC